MHHSYHFLVTGMCDSTATSAFNGKFGWSWTE
ncbi:hypothetical protein LINPERHAP2_LOCUS15189, partial [Linum perenne]